MSMPPQGQVTELLLAWSQGEGSAAERLMPLVYDEPRQRAASVVALDDALRALAALDPDKARLVELRYFTGLTIDETAEMLGRSASTVKREWALARAWLHREIAGGACSPDR
jgi:RNA polymerase sigma factor (sigma-70 family)